MREIHLTKKDFKIDWFSGTGAGGQNRNKTQNCCRITHIETGLTSVGQTERDRPANQAFAFKNLAKKIIAHYKALDTKKPEISNEVIRTYHAERNVVLDKASGLTKEYKEVVEKGNLEEMIQARKQSIQVDK